jgi:RNA polymerase sigma-70 factor, ECF subfamily
MASADWYTEIHGRLLAGDPTASAELVDRLIDPLSEQLGKRYAKLSVPELLADAVADALIGYIRNPIQFDGKKRGLFGFLLMSADGDLKNALAKLKRRNQKEISLDDVEVDRLGGNNAIDDSSLVAMESQKVAERLDNIFKDKCDRKLVSLIILGVRSTAEFVEILDLHDLSIQEQRRAVKRHKDRIIKRLKRFGKVIDKTNT